ncbi:hypothetical protein DSCO28_16620 [Desulfosarcina ovata subsp. sediminis]|uniref:Uncharacterized protein n=1 Tax=Desulfosarcina ovata subsp. sediminis TaxID=885957 RepID=A0A5K7ZJC3_9BACT|nr:hypothetical protein DSCO28_16620 [Desulfosarcina ovata subsp. sediminis]
MPINKTIKYLYLSLAVFFQLYLAYAATLYLKVKSLSFGLVVLTALCSAVVIGYYICVAFERKNPEQK